MREKNVRSSEMSRGAYVEDAVEFAKGLTLSETSCAGDYGNAMDRVARKLRVGRSVLKHLHYSQPKRVDAADFVALGAEYGRRQLSQKTGFVPRTAIGRVLVGVADALDRIADSLDREEGGALDEQRGGRET